MVKFRERLWLQLITPQMLIAGLHPNLHTVTYHLLHIGHTTSCIGTGNWNWTQTGVEAFNMGVIFRDTGLCYQVTASTV